MPKQIKKPTLKEGDKFFRKASIAGLIISVIFFGTIIGLIQKIVDSESKLFTTILFSAYVIYTAVCVFIIIVGIRTYLKEENFGILFQSILAMATFVTILMNLRFALVMLLSAYGFDSTASEIMGSQTSTEFVSSQYASWVALCGGILVMIIIGISAIVKLTKNK